MQDMNVIYMRYMVLCVIVIYHAELVKQGHYTY